MTGTSSVGAGLVRPMSSVPINTDAYDFFQRYRSMKPAALGRAFIEFTKSRNYQQHESYELQEVLIKQFGMIGLSQRLIYE